MRRSMTYKKHWQELIELYGGRCFYCRQEIATTIDHVVPYDWDADNDIENLVPACGLCNSLASDKMFENVESKRQYILMKRKDKKSLRSICVECLIPFSYRVHGHSMFLCPECDAIENETKFNPTKEWVRWIDQLREAGIPIEAHRQMRYVTDGYSKVSKLEKLVDFYAEFADQDKDFLKQVLRQ
jgi:HNH endonuclease